MTQHHEGSFTTADKRVLYRQSWLPDADITAVVILIHGLAEHSGRYADLARYLNSAGYGVETFDLRGHGRSDGPRAMIRSYDEFMADVAQFRSLVTAEHPDRPLVIAGHSMGGHIVMGHLIRAPKGLAGAVLSGPALVAGDDLGAVTAALAPLIGRLAPRLRLTQLDATSICRDPAVVDRYLNDPLVFNGKISAGLGGALLAEMATFPNHYSRLDLPILLLHGTADKLASVDGSRQLEASATTADITAHYYEGWYHEVFNEPDHLVVYRDLVTWLDQVAGTAD
ncbi:MAG: lysophospholipase [Ilumatobacter coccineus]|uniref:Monoacylglycerol lipase n=1 Tax=Ilumatobacter coccineus TaxID=467094 RepID=A0A2G6KE82_9ACTN|nr:MAG: lysophospholipase [Ilumatobacter coccineus]